MESALASNHRYVSKSTPKDTARGLCEMTWRRRPLRQTASVLRGGVFLRSSDFTEGSSELQQSYLHRPNVASDALDPTKAA